jgi:hypothetical protein
MAMSNLLGEQRLSLAQLAKREQINVSTAWRWCLRGVKGVRLECFSVGGRKFTTDESFRRFVEATTAAAGGQPAPTTPAPTTRQRERQIAAANDILDAAGV